MSGSDHLGVWCLQVRASERRRRRGDQRDVQDRPEGGSDTAFRVVISLIAGSCRKKVNMHNENNDTSQTVRRSR